MPTIVRNVLASLAVRDLEAASTWYGTLLDDPGESPMPEVREWSFPGGGGLQIYQAPDRAGKGSCTLAVDGIDAIVAKLRALQVDTRDRSTSDRVDTVMVTDLDGNHLAFAHAKDPSLVR